jgi:hypothetical protein
MGNRVSKNQYLYFQGVKLAATQYHNPTNHNIKSVISLLLFFFNNSSVLDFTVILSKHDAKFCTKLQMKL